MNSSNAQAQSLDSEKLHAKKEKHRQTAICANFDKSVVLWSPGDISSMVLREGFNLHRIPKNYLTRKSYIEKLIYHATMSDSMKSPFAGFKIANDYLDELDHIDVIGGIKTFKTFIRSFFRNNGRTSTMIHKIGKTWLLNEFDIDSFLLSGGDCHEWLWLREFLKKEDYRLCSHSLSRNVLISHDLESKFLYHTVFQSPELDLREISIQQPKSLLSSSDEVYTASEIVQEVVCTSLDLSPKGTDDEHSSSIVNITSSADDVVQTSYREQNNGSKQQFWSSCVMNSDIYLHTAEWQLKDLSFVIGSDMPIFGTPKNPCISLKLSPLHESINFLTGIDVWLENIINEVPEVAMCYHHEGIVMQEYEIYKTCEIPSIIGFETEQINQIIRNLIMFLKRNATQEGHTYWLVKEPGLDVVKLYDLTTLGYKEFLNKCSEEPKCRETFMKDNNPFILPVASLSYKLAEIRVKEYTHYRETQIFQSACNPSSSPPRYSTDDNGYDETNTVLDALRLLKNCLNLISVHENFSNMSDISSLSSNSAQQHTSPGINDLKFRAVLLLCRLYLITPTSVIMECFKNIQGLVCSSRETVSVDIEQFGKSIDAIEAFHLSDDNQHANLTLVPINANHNYLGSMIIDALRKSNTSQLSQLAISILGSYKRNPDFDHQDKMLTAYSSTSSSITVNSHHQQQNMINNTNEMNESQTYSLPFAVLKSYIAKSEELWFTVYQQMHNTDTLLNPMVIESLRMIFKYTLPALMLLEHLVPDTCTTAYTHCLLIDRKKQLQQLSIQKPNCPYCFSYDLIKNPLDHRCLADTLLIVSCLFSAAFISYPEALQRTNPINNSSHHLSVMTGQSNLGSSVSVDTFIMQSACEQSKAQMKIYLDTVLLGPVKLPIVSSATEKVSNNSPMLTKYTNWFNILNFTACCLQRVLRQSTETTCYQEQSRKSAALMKRATNNKSGFSHDLKGYMNRLKITNDWWPVLMNMIVCNLRSMWLDCVNNANQDEPVHSTFNRLLDQCLNILLSNPFDSPFIVMTSAHTTGNTATTVISGATISNNNNSIKCMSMASYNLIDTNEFQLFKLLALYSQSYSASASSSSPPWSNKLSSLVKWRTNQDRLLPNETLFFNHSYSKTSSVKNDTKFQFSLIAVCLARSIEALLHYQLSQGHSIPSAQVCLDLLLTTNEYLSICLEEFKSLQVDKLEYLDVVNNVLKQVLRCLPSDLTPYSIASPSTTNLPTTSEGSNPIKMTVNKDILRSFVNLRLHQLNTMLLRHNHGMAFKRGKAQTPAWFSMIAQVRTTLDWHASYLDDITYDKEEKLFSVDPQDIVLHVTLLSHLVNLQTVNQDVLSVLGIQAILRDICRIHPILRSINSPAGCFTPIVYSDLQGPLNSISRNLYKLCSTLAGKSQNCRHESKSSDLTKSTSSQKHSRKNNKQKGSSRNNNDKLSEQTQEIVHLEKSQESVLLSNIKQQTENSCLKTELKLNQTNDPCQIFNSSYQVLQLQIEHVIKYLSEL
ncbi:Erythroid differentiation-related factor 1 isoform 2 [Schistosoma japonicum]|uniref:Erythroid differentiation-related factor 1 isoform 2 n=1 Tax=Schistosoma japonicum TaxID=6182 RepID=A0A4Z2DSZ7_SCHJA|nr:Erythroid differentiation-related factor 1 isoform 2 [Schistosoma japonicum]